MSHPKQPASGSPTDQPSKVEVESPASPPPIRADAATQTSLPDDFSGEAFQEANKHLADTAADIAASNRYFAKISADLAAIKIYGSKSSRIAPRLLGSLTTSRDSEADKRQDELAEDLIKTKRELRVLQQTNDSNAKALVEKQLEIDKKQRLQHLLNSVESEAVKRLHESEEFVKQFDQPNCYAFVMSVDIRGSTDLMLKAVSPRHFADFITELCEDLREAILHNHGVFDKFTGDGILAFFPNFYSGVDAGFLAVRAAAECHAICKEVYKKHLGSFMTSRSNVGLGIGIDWGQVELVNTLGSLTVVGTPVVYACRYGGSPAGSTYLNEQAYRALYPKYIAYCTFTPSTVTIKHEGDFNAYRVELNGNEFTPKEPEWMKPVALAPAPVEESQAPSAQSRPPG